MPTKRQRSNASFKSTRTNRFWSWAAACALRSRPPWRVERRRHALPCPSFRQGNQLAEGQKSAEVKHDFTIYPPPPIKTVGGGGRISREIRRFFAFRAIIWRRGSPTP